MTSLLEYYRDPIFSILLLLCLALIAASASALAASLKERKILLRARSFVQNLQPSAQLANLDLETLYELANLNLLAAKYLRAKECFLELARRDELVAYELAVCDIHLRLYSQASKNLELALAYVAQDERALRALIYASFKQGDLKAALDAARALAIIADASTLKFLENSENKLKLVDKEVEYVCSKCSHTSKIYEPFCSKCFALTEPKIYERRAYEA